MDPTLARTMWHRRRGGDRVPEPDGPPAPAIAPGAMMDTVDDDNDASDSDDVVESDNMRRLEAIVARLPEAVRVDIEAWEGEPTFRVRKKNFVFTNRAATGLSVKLSKEEAAAVVATDPGAEPTGYGLGRHGWVSVQVGDAPDDDRWQQIEEWVRTSYTLVAPKTLAKVVLGEDGIAKGNAVR